MFSSLDSVSDANDLQQHDIQNTAAGPEHCKPEQNKTYSQLTVQIYVWHQWQDFNSSPRDCKEKCP